MADRQRALNDDYLAKEHRIRCDAFGCEESYPLEHECLGEPCFGTGRWLGWLYLDLNRPDLFPRELRFCSVSCVRYWLDRESVDESTRRRMHRTPLDEALSRPMDETARQRAGIKPKAVS